MVMLKEVLLSVLGILLAFPAGYFLARLTRDELVRGRKFFELLIIASMIVLFSALVIQNQRLAFAVMLSMIFSIIVSLISLYKSFDKKFVRN